MNFKTRILNILFWSVLSAAFIGPGTITTAASAGAGYGFSLIWALVFSTVACVVLQEASARLTLASGQNLGQVIKNRFKDSLPGKFLVYLVLTAILLGCAAYEAGNILGGVEGAALILDIPTAILALIIGLIAALLLWFGSPQRVAQVLGIIVAVMGICFLSTAIVMKPSFGELISVGMTPSIPSGSELLVIGLIGTTVVPYNLFLGSGLKHTQTMKEMRWSLSLAIILGGLVSIGVLIVGSSIAGNFTYEALAGELEQSLGGWAGLFFGIGLFAAGLSSALTAPLAAAITARSMLQNSNVDTEATSWQDDAWKYRLIWCSVLGIGILFGVLQVQPIPAIILAQALNGIILPVVAIVLLLMVNDARLLNSRAINSNIYNLLMGLIVLATLVIGLTNLAKALSSALAVSLVNEQLLLWISIGLSLLLCWPVVRTLNKYRERR